MMDIGKIFWSINLFIVMVYATMWLSILAHELGHLICAMVCGRRPMSMRVGRGKSLKFNLFGVAIEFGRQPFGGNIAYTRSVDWRKSVITLCGGPAANFLIAVGAAVWLFMGAPWFLWVVLFINAYYVWEDVNPVDNSDGMQIKKTLARKRRREAEYQEYLAKNP